MKKGLKYFSLFLALILVLTGCGKKSSETKENKENGNVSIEDAFEKTFDAKGFSVNGTVSMKMAVQGMNAEIKADIKGDVYKGENLSSHLITTATAIGMNTKAETYTVVKDGEQYTYQKTDNEGWEYAKSKVTDSFKKEDFVNALKEAKENKKVDSDKEGYTKYEVTFDTSKLTGKLNLGDLTSIPAMDLTANIYVKDGYVSIISIDLSELYKKMMSDSTTTGSIAGSADITASIYMELSNFGNVNEITVPQDVVSSAKESNDIESSLNLLG